MAPILCQSTIDADSRSSLQEAVCAAQQGDRNAFGRLAERYQRVVYATVFRRLGNHAESQEVCQEVFLRAMRKIGQVRDPRCFSGWLRSIAVRMAINRAVRGRGRCAAGADRLDEMCGARQTPLADMLLGERRSLVRQGLSRLGPLDRETLVAFYFDGRSLIEMADQFRSPLGTIKRRLHVARQRLARQLAAMA